MRPLLSVTVIRKASMQEELPVAHEFPPAHHTPSELGLPEITNRMRNLNSIASGWSAS